MKVQCVTCGGIFHDVQADGVSYFHTCPPLSDAEVGVALGYPADQSTWTKAQRAAVAATPRTRDNHRDENRPGTAHADAGKLKAPGLGVKPVATTTGS